MNGGSGHWTSDIKLLREMMGKSVRTDRLSG